MGKAQIPENENERLGALEALKILDTLPEKEYDDITKLASFICKTPVALVTLVDEKRQFFKSKIGLEDSSTSRDMAFCAHAILTPGEETIVADARLDARFSDNPLVTDDPHVVFYAGIPLLSPEGFPLGTLCVIDKKPRVLTKQQLAALRSLSNQVMKLLELRKSNLSLIEAHEKLQVYSDQMEAFAYTASHDLKEPARMVSSFMKLFQEKYAEGLNEEAQTYIHFAVDGAKRMTMLINELLVYSELDNTDSAKEEVDIEMIVKEVVALFRGVIEENGASINYDKLPVIKASRTGVKLVFQNIVGNAIKYHAPDGKPIIKISGEETDSQWKFAIEDNGIGIKEENYEMIFQLFKRLHTRGEYAGTGMGLATCKKIIEAHGGSIWVESEVNKGSIFYFTIAKYLG